MSLHGRLNVSRLLRSYFFFSGYEHWLWFHRLSATPVWQLGVEEVFKTSVLYSAADSFPTVTVEDVFDSTGAHSVSCKASLSCIAGILL